MMPNKDFIKYFIKNNCDIRSAMKKLDGSHRKILFVIKSNNTLFKLYEINNSA